MTKLLAFDAALWRSAYVVMEDDRLLDTAVLGRVGRDRLVQLRQLYEWARLAALLEQPDLVAVETSAFWQRAGHDRTATIVALAAARTAIELGVMSAGKCRIAEMGVHRVRELVCGNRQASKAQVAECLRLRGYQLPVLANGEVDSDCADAVALGAAVWSEERLRERGINAQK